MDLKRPSVNETEHELLHMQQEFLSSKYKPAAQVVNKRKSASNNAPLDEDKSEESKKFKLKDTKNETFCEIDDDESFDNHDMQVAEVLANIVERDVKDVTAKLPEAVNVPFPKTFVRDKKITSNEGKVKKSLFALQMEKRKQKSMPVTVQQRPSTSLPFIEGSLILDGEGLNSKEDVAIIHKENMEKLATMSKEEIIAHQQHLLKQLDPNIVKFLQNKKKQPEINRREHKLKCKEKIKEDSSNHEEVEIAMDVNNDLKVKSKEMEENSNNMDIDEAALPIKPSEAKKWLHMDVVEKEKMLWMTELPPPKPIDPKTGYPARFDFKGKLLAHNEDISVILGLHHHGEEQEVPGYTIEELFIMARSAFQAQNIVSFQTLSAILRNNWQGLYDECLNSSLLQQLLDAGIVPLLRCSLDKNLDTLIAAVILAIRNLIFNETDELCLDWVSSWKYGYITPFLKPLEEEREKNTETQELTDIEIVKLDVIKGFLRMDLLPRLRYILEICHPDAATVGYILDILIRIGRHSLESATKIIECPRLMQTITSEFLPKNWKFAEILHGQQCNAYGVPLRPAVKLIRILASAGRHIASRLVADFDVLGSLCCYITMDPSDNKLPHPEALLLSNEAMKTWRVFLLYGLAKQEYINLFPLLLKKLCFFQSLNIHEDAEKNVYYYDSAAILFSIFESLINIIINKSKEDFIYNSAPFTWDCITDVYNVVEICSKKWLCQAVLNESYINTSGSIMLGCALSFISKYYKYITSSNVNVVDMLHKIELFNNQYLVPFFKSEYYKKLIESLSTYSALLCKENSGNKRDAATLPSLSCIMWASDIMKIVKTGTPFPLLLSIADLIYVMQNVHHNIEQMVEDFLQNNLIVKYVHQIIETRKLHSSEWMCRFETIFLSLLTLLSKYRKLSPDYHNLSLRLISNINEEYFVKELKDFVIFSPDFLRNDYNELDHHLQMLQLGDKIPVKSATGELINSSNIELLKKTLQQLPAIASMYSDSCLDRQTVERSRWRIEQDCNKITSLSTNIFKSQRMERDWPYTPIKKLYTQAKTRNFQEDNSEKAVEIVAKCLQWIHLLECLRSKITKYIPGSVRFCNLSIVFLTANDMFLHEDIKQYYCASLRELLKNTQRKRWKLETVNTPGISSFLDLYTELLNQFEAVSYGDHLFGNTILLPLQQCQYSDWKKLLFTEHVGALRILGVPLHELLVPNDKYFDPVEEDEEVLSLYARSLFSGQLREKWSPLLYSMAVYHLRCYIEKFVDTQQELEVLLDFLKFKQMDDKQKQMAENFLKTILSR